MGPTPTTGGEMLLLAAFVICLLILMGGLMIITGIAEARRSALNPDLFDEPHGDVPHIPGPPKG